MQSRATDQLVRGAATPRQLRPHEFSCASPSHRRTFASLDPRVPTSMPPSLPLLAPVFQRTACQFAACPLPHGRQHTFAKEQSAGARPCLSLQPPKSPPAFPQAHNHATPRPTCSSQRQLSARAPMGHALSAQPTGAKPAAGEHVSGSGDRSAPRDHSSGEDARPNSHADRDASSQSHSRESSSSGSGGSGSGNGGSGSGGSGSGGAGGASSASVDAREVRKFEELSAEWWNPRGPFAALHALNHARATFARESILAHFHDVSTALAAHCKAESGAAADVSQTVQKPAQNGDANPRRPLQGLRIIDVGCGGGIFAESLCRLGAEVTGVDVTRANINVASGHAKLDPGLARSIRYECVSAEEVAQRGDRFDVVVSSEVIEHVKHPDAFCQTLAQLCAPAGCVLLTTMNRTAAAYALAIVAAEKVLGMAPDGTHDWRKFLTPQELQLMMGAAGFNMKYIAGLQLDVLSNSWQCTSDTSVNYAALFARE